MPINSTMPPKSVSRALTNALRAFLGRDRKPKRQGFVGKEPSLPDAASLGLKLTSIDVATIDQHHPLRVYTLHLNNLSDGGIRAAAPTGWRFLVGNPSKKITLCTVTRQPVTGAWRLTSAYYGPQVDRVLTAKNALKSLQQAKTGSYELRILVIPAFNVEAFWLFDTSPNATDLVAVYVDGTKYVVPKKVQPAATFLRALDPNRQRATANA